MRIYPRNCDTDIGEQVVTIKLEDDEPKATFYDITIIVKNKPPFFLSSIPPPDMTVMLNSIISLPIPPFHDPEGCPVRITISQKFLQ
jgi:hypothetical protein